MQINRNKYISTNAIDQHNHITNFAYTLQFTEINMAKHSHVTNNDHIPLPPQTSTSIVNFSYRQLKFCKQPLAGIDNPQKRWKSIYPSFEHAMQVCENNELTKTLGTLIPLEKSLIDRLGDQNGPVVKQRRTLPESNNNDQVSLGLLPDEAYSLSVDDDIAAAAGLEEREDVYSNEDITASNLEWNNNLYANPYTSL